MEHTVLKVLSFKTTSFKTNIVLNIFIGIVLFFFLFFLISSFLKNKDASVISFLCTAIITPIITRFISNNNTTISIEDNQLLITTETDLPYKIHYTAFLIEEIKCYEISNSKLFTSIVFYINNGDPYNLILGRNASNTSRYIELLLTENNIPSLKEIKHLTQEPFKKRFKNALLFNCAFFCIIISIHYSIIFFHKLYLDLFFSISFNYIALFGICIVLTYSIIFKKIWGKTTRYSTSSGCTYLTSFYLLLTIGFSTEKLNNTLSKEVRINNVYEVKGFKNNRFFRIDDYDFKGNKISHKQRYQKRSKSIYYTITNTYYVPFNNRIKDNLVVYNPDYYRLEHSFEHKKRNISRQSLYSTIQFDNKEFDKIIKNEISFFELLKTHAVRNKNNEAVYEVHTLKPHFKCFNDFKQQEKDYLIYFMAGAVAICLLNSFLIAKSR